LLYLMSPVGYIGNPLATWSLGIWGDGLGTVSSCSR
jgi:hypothetical protein